MPVGDVRLAQVTAGDLRLAQEGADGHPAVPGRGLEGELLGWRNQPFRPFVNRGIIVKRRKRGGGGEVSVKCRRPWEGEEGGK
eukprot:777216-Prorocentrum_minimum.AAC.2